MDENGKKKLTRREMLKLIGVGTVGTVLASCVKATAPEQSTEVIQPTLAAAIAVSVPKYSEAPILASKVKAGQLPPVDQRLPENPLVVTPHQNVGKYGGLWRQSVLFGNKVHAMAGLGFYAARGLVVYSEDMSKIVPNIASSVDLNADAKVFTIKLRKGLKWSDGQPLETKDIEFWWKAFATNTTLNPTQTNWEGVEVKILDDITFEIKWPTSSPLQYIAMAEYQWSNWFMPMHYLKQFHPDYTAADTVTAAAKAADFDTWDKYFSDRNDYQNNPDLPTMAPWMLITKGSGATQLTFKRNPYYWAVDTNGNQLPYFDGCIMNIVESVEITKMKAVRGEFEVAVATIMDSFSDYPLYIQNAQSGNYQVLTCEFSEPNAENISFNTTHKDPAKRAILEKPAFRQAMSLAMNRPDIINTTLTVGLVASTPRNFSPAPNSPYFDKDLSSQYTSFDKGTANKMLDDLGLNKRDANGMRLLPDGSAFSLVWDVVSTPDNMIDMATMVAKNWQDVGINITARTIDPSLFSQRVITNDQDCTGLTGSGGFPVLDISSVNDYTGYLSFSEGPHLFNRGNYIWRDTNGKEGIEPSDTIKKLWNLGAAIIIEPNKDKQAAMVQQVFQIHTDNLFILGIGTRLPAIYLVKNNVKNVPKLDVDWLFGMTGHGRPEQYYLEQ